MASPSCPFCNQPIRAGAKFCANCGRTLIAPPVPSGNGAGVTCAKCGASNRSGAKFCANCRAPLAAPNASQNVGVKCLQCGTFNRVGARFCAKCRSDLPAGARAPVVKVPRKRVEKERGLSPNTWRIFAALGAGALVLLCLVSALAAYIALGKPTAIASNPSPAPTPGASVAPLPQTTPAPIAPPMATPATDTPSPRVTSDLYGYQNTAGRYAFNYPATWKGKMAGTDAYFQLPDNARVEIIVRLAAPGETLKPLSEDAGPLSVATSNPTQISIGAATGWREDILDATGSVRARAYRVLRNDRFYYLTLFAPAESAGSSLAQALDQFDQVIASFQFLPG